MKRIMILLLAVVMVFCVAACAGEPSDTSSTSSTSKATSSTDDSSKTSSATSSATSSETSSEETSSADASSDTSTEESSTDPDGLEVDPYVTQYLSWGGTAGTGLVSRRATDATSCRITGVNTGAVENHASVLAFNSAYGDDTIYSENGSYDNYAVFVFEYDSEAFYYKLTKTLDVDTEGKDDTEIPADGFVVAVHSHFADAITAIKAVEEGSSFYPHGFRGSFDVDSTIKTGKATVDGKVDEKEYGKPVWTIEPEELICSYEQFEKDNYYSTAKVYMMWDADYLYLGVVVNSPYHNCALGESNAGSMYNYECIQVNVTSVDPNGAYIAENWDNVVNGTAAGANIVRQYGFAVNDDGETLNTMWMGSPQTFGGQVKCIRDDEAQTTTYEVAIPWSECGKTDETIEAKKGTVFGFSLSVNSGNNTFKNIFLRDGGGIIGLNDWTKVPAITLG